MPDNGPGEVRHSDDERHSPQKKKDVKPLRHVEDTTKGEDNTSSSNRDTSKLEDTPTSETETSTSAFTSETWGKIQFSRMTQHLQDTGQLTGDLLKPEQLRDERDLTSDFDGHREPQKFGPYSSLVPSEKTTKRKADELDDIDDRPTKKPLTEVTKKLDTEQIVEVPDKENRPRRSLSAAEKANDRKNELLPTDRMRRVLGPINNR